MCFFLRMEAETAVFIYTASMHPSARVLLYSGFETLYKRLCLCVLFFPDDDSSGASFIFIFDDFFFKFTL